MLLIKVVGLDALSSKMYNTCILTLKNMALLPKNRKNIKVPLAKNVINKSCRGPLPGSKNIYISIGTHEVTISP